MKFHLPKQLFIAGFRAIYDNVKVDKNAKESLNFEVTDFKIPFNNFKSFINKYVCDKWQTLWNETPFNKLKEIEPIIIIDWFLNFPDEKKSFLLVCE